MGCILFTLRVKEIICNSVEVGNDNGGKLSGLKL